MGSTAELEGYGEKSSSVLIRLAAQVLNDGVDPEVDEPARHAGIAYTVAGLLAAFPLHASQRRLYLPLDAMRRHDANPEDAFAGTATPELMRVLAEMREIARAHLAKTSVTNLPASLMPAFLPAALVRPLLKSLERDADPFVPHPLPAWRRQWLLWRAARDRRRIV